MTFAGSLARLCWCWPWLLFSVLRWCFEWAERILRFHRYHGYENGKTRRWRQYFRTAAVVLRVDSFSGAHGCVFGMQATYVILLRYTLRIHVLSGVMEVWFPAFGCEKYLFCAKMAIWNRLFCAVVPWMPRFSILSQCHRGYCAWDQPSEKEDDDGLNPREHSLQNQADFAGNKHSLCS